MLECESRISAALKTKRCWRPSSVPARLTAALAAPSEQCQYHRRAFRYVHVKRLFLTENGPFRVKVRPASFSTRTVSCSGGSCRTKGKKRIAGISMRVSQPAAEMNVAFTAVYLVHPRSLYISQRLLCLERAPVNPTDVLTRR